MEEEAAICLNVESYARKELHEILAFGESARVECTSTVDSRVKCMHCTSKSKIYQYCRFKGSKYIKTADYIIQCISRVVLGIFTHIVDLYFFSEEAF